MKGLIPFVVVIALLGAGGYMMFTNLSEQLDEATFLEKLNAQRVQFVEQAAVTRMVPDDKFPFDRAQLIGWHLKEVNKLFEAHPTQKVADRFLKEREERNKDKKNKDLAKEERFKERYTWLKEVWEKQVSRGDYNVLMAQMKEGIRVEITNIEPWTPPEGGKQSLKMDLLLWGPVHDHITFKGLSIQFVREIEETDKRGRTVTKRALAKIEGGGPPNVLHPSGPNPAPEKWIPAWPPNVSVGYYTGLPLFAPDATKFSFAMTVEVRTLGGTSTPIEFKWENIDVDPSWKAPPGSVWDANVAEATEEELAAAGIKP